MARRRKHPVRRYPILGVAAMAGSGAGIAAYSWLGVVGPPLLWVDGVTTALVLLAWVTFKLRVGVGYGAIYVIYGLDPWTGYTSETCLYVGETSQKPWTDDRGRVHYPRLEQHLLGGGRYNSAAKDWADTVTRWHFTNESYRGLKPVRMWRERRKVHRLRPLYNHEYNLRNPRRIGKHEQAEQRADREALGLARR